MCIAQVLITSCACTVSHAAAAAHKRPAAFPSRSFPAHLRAGADSDAAGALAARAIDSLLLPLLGAGSASVSEALRSEVPTHEALLQPERRLLPQKPALEHLVAFLGFCWHHAVLQE